MKHCRACDVDVATPAVLCPLCGTPLAGLADAAVYPPAGSRKEYNFVKRLLLLLSVVGAAVCIVVNLLVMPSFWWWTIVVTALVYAWAVVPHAMRRGGNAAGKVLMQVVAGSALAVLVDFETGYRGWGVSFVVPAFICAGMGLKALGYNLLSGTTEALTYDSLKTAGRERDYIKVDAKASIFMKLASALGALASLLAGVLTSAGYYLADAAVSAVSALAAANLTEPVVTDEQAAREKHILQELPARLRVHILADAVISLPSYLTSMFVQQRLTQQGWAMEWLFLPGLLAGAAGMAGASLGRRLHPKRLRALYFGCALLVGTGTLLAGAAPALLCAAGPVLVQGALSVWFLHSMQRLNDAIPSDRRATLISVDSMAYSLLMIPASPLVGLVGDLTGQAGAGLCVLCALVVVSGLAAAGKTRYNGRGA